jgi:hypothetical protein
VPEPAVGAVLSASASASAVAAGTPSPTRKPLARKDPAARTEPKPAAGSDDPFLRRR